MQSHKNAPKFAFLYLLSLVALVFVAISLGMIIFQIINKEILDIINQYQGRYSDEAMKFGISAIIISAPIFYITSRHIYKSLFKGELHKDAGVRRWLTYFILLVAAIVMIGWLIGTLNSFLGGELTTKFLLKALTALVISGAIFSFYLYDIRREKVEGHKDKVIRLYFFASLAVILVVFVSSWFIVESPAETRKAKIDQEILRNWHDIHFSIRNYYEKEEALPENLEVLLDKEYFSLAKGSLENPATNKKYEYEIMSDNEYKICTDFLTSNLEELEETHSRVPGYTSSEIEFHDQGYQCFTREVKSMYDSTMEREPVRVY